MAVALLPGVSTVPINPTSVNATEHISAPLVVVNNGFNTLTFSSSALLQDYTITFPAHPPTAGTTLTYTGSVYAWQPGGGGGGVLTQNLLDIEAMSANVPDRYIKTNGSNLVLESASSLRSTIGAQPSNLRLNDVSNLSPVSGNYVGSSSTNLIMRTPSQVLNDIGAASSSSNIVDVNAINSSVSNTYLKTNGTNIVAESASNVRTSINAQAASVILTSISALPMSPAGNYITTNGTGFSAQTPSALRIAIDAQQTNARLNDVSAIVPNSGYILGSTGSNLVLRSPAQALNDISAQPASQKLTDISNLSSGANFYLKTNGTSIVSESASSVLTTIGAQPLSSRLTEVSNITPTATSYVGGNGSALVARSALQVRADILAQPLNSNLTDIAAIPVSTPDRFIMTNGSNLIGVSPSTVLTTISGQPLNDKLTELSNITPTAGNFIGGNGINFVNKTPSQVRNDISAQASSQNLVDVSAVQATTSNLFLRTNGTNIVGTNVADVMTVLGAQPLNSNLSDISIVDKTIPNLFLRTDGMNIVSATPSNVRSIISAQLANARLTDISALAPTLSSFVVGNGSNLVMRTPAQAVNDIGALALSGGTMTGVLNMGGNDFVTSTITAPANITLNPVGAVIYARTPSSDNEITNKSYVDSIALGSTQRKGVYAMTAAPLPSYTYDNGTNGVGATITGDSGTLILDGVAIPALGYRILVTTEGVANGIYNIIQLDPWILMRVYVPSSNPPNELEPGTVVLILSGNTRASTVWVEVTPPPITVGTSVITYMQILAQHVTGGTGINVSGNNISISDTGVIANTYNFPNFTINAQGQITSINGNTLSSIGAQAANARLDDISVIDPMTADGFLKTDGSNIVSTSAASVLSTIGAQPLSSRLSEISILTPTASNFIAGNGSSFVLRTASQVRTDISAQPLNTNLTNVANINSGVTDTFLKTNGSAIVAVNASSVLSTINAQQASGRLTDITAITPALGSFIGSTSTNLVARTPAQVRSDISAQLLNSNLSDISAISVSVADTYLKTNGSAVISESAASVRSTIGAQPLATRLTELSILTPNATNFIGGSGSEFVMRTPAQVRSDIDVPQNNARLTDIIAVSASNVNNILITNGTNIVTALPLDVRTAISAQPENARLNDIAVLSPVSGNFVSSNSTNLIFRTSSQVRADISAQPASVKLDAIDTIDVSASNTYLKTNGTTIITESASSVRTTIGAQPVNARLTDVSAIIPTLSNFVGSSATNLIMRTPSQVLSDISAQHSSARLDDISAIVATNIDYFVKTDGNNIVITSPANALTSLGALSQSGGTMMGILNMGGFRISGLADPVGTSDAVNSTFIKDRYAHKYAMRVKTTGTLTSFVYVNGSSGVGATLTAPAPSVLNIDGISMVLGDYILVANQTSSNQNGAYVVTTEGTGGVSSVLTRLYNFDTSGAFKKFSLFIIAEGTVGKGTKWYQSSSDSPTIGTSGITYASADRAYQVSNARLDDISAITPSAGSYVGSSGTNLIIRTPAQVRSDIGAVNISGDTITGNLSLGTNQLTVSTITTSSGDLTLTSFTGNVISAGVPTQANHVVNKSYADSIASGLLPRAGCRLKSSSTLPSYTYSNGTSGFGATISGASGTLTLDGSAVSINDRVLITHQTFENGVYSLTQNNPWILTRTVDYDNNPVGELVRGSMIWVASGTTYANTTWVQLTDAPTVGVTSITYTQSAGPGTVTAGTGISVTGNQVSIANTGITSGAFTFPNVTFNSQGQATSVISNTLSSIGAQGLNARLTDISGITPSSGSFIGSNSSNLIIRTPAQVRSDISAQLSNARLDDISGITPSSGSIVGSSGSNIILRTPAQARGDIGAQATSARLDDISAISASNSNYFLNTNGSAIISSSPATALGLLGAIAKSGDSMTGALGMGGFKITGLGAPSSYNDAMTYGYSHDKFSFKVAARCGTTTNISFTYSNGSSGLGATLTAAANGVLIIDGISIQINDTILINDQTTAFQNGLYIVTTEGTVSVAAVLTRHPSFALSSGFNKYSMINVLTGTINAGTTWYLISNSSPTVGTTSISFTSTASKQPLSQNLTDISNISAATPNLYFRTNGTSIISETASSLRSTISAQASNARLNDISALTPTITNIIGANGTNLIMRTPVQARSDIGAVNIAGDTMSGILNMGANKITNLGTPTLTTDAVTKTYADTADNLRVLKTGDTMSGVLTMNANISVASTFFVLLGTDATADSHAIHKKYFDTTARYYCNVYVPDSAGQTNFTISSPPASVNYVPTGGFQTRLTNGFTVGTSSVTYSGNFTRIFKLDYSFAVTSSGNSDQSYYIVMKNGVQISQRVNATKGSSSDFGMTSGIMLVSLAPSDIITFQVGILSGNNHTANTRAFEFVITQP